jgi:tripartite ATP-independent transporter DctM subunit
MILALFFGTFAVLLIMGMPIALAMVAAAWVYALAGGFDLGFLALQMFTALDFFVLLAIPLFILAAEVMNRTGVSQRIFAFADAVVGSAPGGLGHVNVATSIIFSGMSGSAVADVGGIGRLCYRAMVERGYDKPFSAALTASSAVIGPIIPPSIPMIVFSMVSGVSVAKLFFAGAVPGLLIGLVLMLYVYFVAKRRNYPAGGATSWRVLGQALVAGTLPLLTPVILLGSIYFGIVTITEAAAVATLYALALGVFAYRTLSLADFVDCLKNTFVTGGSILILLPAAKVFGFALTTEGVSAMFAGAVLGISSDPLFVLLMINLLFLGLGLISDPNVNIMLFVPIVMPMALAVGLDPVHVGVVIVVNCMIGLVTPPVGGLLFAICGLEKLRMEEVTRAIWPFLAILLGVVAVISLVPQLSLALPRMLF